MLAQLDIGITAIYLAALILLGFVLSQRGQTSTSDYFLASRKTSWPAIGLALVGTNISPGVLIGITGSAYAFGISVYNYDWMATVILVIFAVYFLPAVLASRVYTMPEFLERRYDWRVRAWFSALTLLLYILLDAAGTLYCGTLVLRFLLPGVSFQNAVAILAVLSVLYSVTGGLRAVLYTQAIQAVMVLASAFLLAVFAFDKAGGWQAVLHDVPSEALSLIRPASDPLMPWTGLAFGAPVIAFYFWCTNQVIVQRMLAARSIEDGQKGALFAGFLKLSTLALIVLPGVAGRLLYPHIGQADEIYLRLAFGVLPAGALGLLVAAFLGALMAQLSASYNSAATLVTMDFVKRLRPEANEKTVVVWGQISTILCMILSALWAPQIIRFPSLWQYFQAVLAYATPPVAALFLGGMLWPRATAKGGIWAMACGSGVGLALFALSAAGLSKLQFLNAAAIVFVATLAILISVSLVTKQKAEEQERFANFTFAKTIAQAQLGTSSVKLWALALLGLTAIVVMAFR